MRWNRLASCIFSLLFSSMLFCQSNDLSPMEDFAFSLADNVIIPRDDAIGFVDENKVVEGIISNYIHNGVSEDYCVGTSMKVLEHKYDYFQTYSYHENLKIRLHLQKEGEKEIVSNFRLIDGEEKIKGTIYLSFSEGKWLLFDIELDD